MMQKFANYEWLEARRPDARQLFSSALGRPRVELRRRESSGRLTMNSFNIFDQNYGTRCSERAMGSTGTI
jgi:hypothetical protein